MLCLILTQHDMIAQKNLIKGTDIKRAIILPIYISSLLIMTWWLTWGYYKTWNHCFLLLRQQFAWNYFGICYCKALIISSDMEDLRYDLSCCDYTFLLFSALVLICVRWIMSQLNWKSLTIRTKSEDRAMQLTSTSKLNHLSGWGYHHMILVANYSQ